MESMLGTRSDTQRAAGSAARLAQILAEEERLLTDVLDGLAAQRSAVVGLDPTEIARHAAENEARCERARLHAGERRQVLASWLPPREPSDDADYRAAFDALIAPLSVERSRALVAARDRVRALAARVGRENDVLHRLTRHALTCVQGALSALGVVPPPPPTYGANGRLGARSGSGGLMGRRV